MTALPPLHQVEIDQDQLLNIKRNHLVPLLDDQMRLNHFADQIVQAQAVLLNGVDIKLSQQLSQVIGQIIGQLNNSNKVLKNRKFNALQKWLGLDLEFVSAKIKYMKDLDLLVDEASVLSQRLQLEIQKSQSKLQQVLGYREQMAGYVLAASEFLSEYPQFVKNRHPLDNFSERLSKKVNSLQTLQASNDIAITQMLLTQQLSMSLLDRFKEAQQVLIPAWQYHLQQSQQQVQYSQSELEQSREKLIHTLQKSLDKTPLNTFTND